MTTTIRTGDKPNDDSRTDAQDETTTETVANMLGAEIARTAPFANNSGYSGGERR